MNRHLTSLKGEACFIATCCSKALSRRAVSVFSTFFRPLAGALPWGAAATRTARTATAPKTKSERWTNA